MQRTILLASSLLAALLLPACGGGGGGGTSSSAVTGLTPPSELEIVTPVTTAGAPASTGPGGSTVAPGASDPGFPAGAQYNLDEQNVSVYDPAIEPLNVVNSILCFIAQTGSTQLVNVGPYIAQVNVDECEDGQNANAASSSTGQSSATGGEQFEIWTVDSTRTSETSPQKVMIWAPDDQFANGLIYADTQITESASDTMPFGQFSMNFAGADNLTTLANSPFWFGSLATTQIPQLGAMGFQFYQEQGDVNAVPNPGEFSQQVQVNVEMDATQDNGWAHIVSNQRSNFGGDSGIISQEFDVAFDATHFLRSTDGAAAQPFFRNTFTENVWSYNLYYADGATAGDRVDRNSGFGIVTPTGEYGWAGYYGMWLPPSVALSNGATVTKQSFGSTNSTPVSYTVFNAPGRLIRFTKNTLALASIEGQTFQWWQWDSMTGQSMIYQVQHFSATSEWKQVGIIDPQTNQATAITPVVINTAALGVLDMWSDGLGGRVVYVDGDTSVTFFAQEFVDGNDAIFTGSSVFSLYGFVDSLKSAISQADAESGAVYLPDAPDTVTPHVLEFRQSDLTLYNDTDGMGTFVPVGLGAGQVPTMGPNMWGMSSGPLVTPAVAATLVNVWDAWNANVFYVYETGHNSWNQFWGLIDSTGGFVQFDKPLQFTYQHTTADDRNGDSTYNGQTFFLEYQGEGNLSGIPSDGVDLNGDGIPDRYFPLFSLDDGTALVDSAGVNYVVKAIDIEQTMAPDPAYAGSLTTTQAQSLTLPTSAIYSTPTNGAMPTVTDPPRVVNGVIQ